MLNIQKILFISSFTPPLNAGAGRNAYNFGKSLVRKGYSVTLLSLNRKGKLRYKENDEGLKIRRLLYFNHNLLTKIFSLIIILPGYFYHIAKNNVIFIYGGNIIAFEMAILFGNILGKKVIFRSTMFEEDDMETLINKRLGGRIRRKILKRISIYFSINPAFTKSWGKIYHDNDKVFESLHGVDTSVFYPVEKEEKLKFRQKLHLPENIFIIISVGYLIERKGFREVFEALNKLEFPFHYLILGDYQVSNDHYLIKYKQEMKDLYIQGKNLLKNKIIFTGSKVNVDEYLKTSDIFILNSSQEGFPNAVLEAMACGLPCIMREKDDMRTGTEIDSYIYFCKNKNDIIHTIEQLYYSPEKRTQTGKEGAKTLKQIGSFDTIWKNIQKKLEI